MSRHNHDWKTITKVKNLVAKGGKTYAEIGMECGGLSKGQVAGIVDRYKDTKIIDLSSLHEMSPADAEKAIKDAVDQITEGAKV